MAEGIAFGHLIFPKVEDSPRARSSRPVSAVSPSANPGPRTAARAASREDRGHSLGWVAWAWSRAPGRRTRAGSEGDRASPEPFASASWSAWPSAYTSAWAWMWAC